MRLLPLLLALAAFAQTPAPPAPAPPTIESLQAENAQLKAELARLKLSFDFEMRVCSAAVQAGREFVLRPKPKQETESH
jgi:hypothetical protein